MSLAVRDLSFAYLKGKPVLRDISVDITANHRLVALIGPNAAGKSTLFRCIAGMLRPAHGTLFLDDEDLTAVSRRDWSEAHLLHATGHGNLSRPHRPSTSS